jgi:hypothetical protein
MSGELISQDVLDSAFNWLLKSSDEIASARGNSVRMEYKAKRVFARLFRHAEGSVEMRKAFAMDHDEYAEAMENVAIAEETWERAKDQRNRCELILETWRTQEASQRAITRIR